MTFVAPEACFGCIRAVLQLRYKHRRVLLPLLIVLPIAVPLVILALTQRHPTDLQEQKGDKRRTHPCHCPGQYLPPDPHPCQSHPHLPGTPHQHAPCQNCYPRPQRAFPKIIRVPALTPQAPAQELLGMLLGLLLLHPLILLPVGYDFEAKAAGEEQQAEDIGHGDGGGEGGECGGGEGVYGEHGHQAEGDPGCLGEEGEEESGRGGADFFEARVGAVGAYAAEEVGAHFSSALVRLIWEGLTKEAI